MVNKILGVKTEISSAVVFKVVIFKGAFPIVTVSWLPGPLFWKGLRPLSNNSELPLKKKKKTLDKLG